MAATALAQAQAQARAARWPRAAGSQAPRGSARRGRSSAAADGIRRGTLQGGRTMPSRRAGWTLD